MNREQEPGQGAPPQDRGDEPQRNTDRISTERNTDRISTDPIRPDIPGTDHHRNGRSLPEIMAGQPSILRANLPGASRETGARQEEINNRRAHFADMPRRAANSRSTTGANNRNVIRTSRVDTSSIQGIPGHGRAHSSRILPAERTGPTHTGDSGAQGAGGQNPRAAAGELRSRNSGRQNPRGVAGEPDPQGAGRQSLPGARNLTGRTVRGSRNEGHQGTSRPPRGRGRGGI